MKSIRDVVCICLIIGSTGVAVSGFCQVWNEVSYKTSVDEVRRELNEIMQDPRYTPRKTFAQWLGFQLEDLDFKIRRLPSVPLGSFWAKFFYWIFLVWCVLTLLAIFLHFLWTLGLWPRKVRFKQSPTNSYEENFIEWGNQSSFDQLLAQIFECEQNKQYEKALHLQRIALLKKCEELDIVRFHPSKTNGDYRREFPKQNLKHSHFQRFLNEFDRYIYGNANCDLRAYKSIKFLFMGVTDDKPAGTAN